MLFYIREALVLWKFLTKRQTSYIYGTTLALTLKIENCVIYYSYKWYSLKQILQSFPKITAIAS